MLVSVIMKFDNVGYEDETQVTFKTRSSKQLGKVSLEMEWKRIYMNTIVAKKQDIFELHLMKSSRMAEIKRSELG